MIDKYKLNREIRNLIKQRIEFEVIYRKVGETDEDGIKKLLHNKIIASQLIAIGKL